MTSVITSLWFDTEGEEAAKLYTSVFRNSNLGRITLATPSVEKVSGKKAGDVITVEFEINGSKFMALNGGPDFKPNEAVSMMIECEDQDEVDEYWEKLTADGGEESVCGWLKDKWGFSWQIVPRILNELSADPDREKADRVLKAMLTMKKIDVARIEEAANAA